MKCVSKTKAEVWCSGYILKPVTTEQIAKELLNLRYPVERKADSEVYVQCFGNFEVFVNKEALHFDSAKTKELLAYHGEYMAQYSWGEITNGEHQLETAKVEVTKPFPQETELKEKLERLSELNVLLNMDEKGDAAMVMGDDEPEVFKGRKRSCRLFSE